MPIKKQSELKIIKEPFLSIMVAPLLDPSTSSRTSGMRDIKAARGACPEVLEGSLSNP
jgi:hypothetical protein